MDSIKKKKQKKNPCSHRLYKNHLKVDLIPDIKTKQFLEENLGENLCTLELVKDFLGYKSMFHSRKKKKKKRDKLDYIKILLI